MALTAAAVGLGLAWLLLQLAPVAGMPDVARIDEAMIDWRAAAFALGVSLLTVLLFAVVPAVTAARRAGCSAVGSSGRRGRRSTQWLIAVECMLTVALLVGSALLLERLGRLLAVDVGFDLHGLQIASLDPGQAEHSGRGSSRFYSRVLEEFSAATGMEAAAFSRMPLDVALADSVEIRTGRSKPDRAVRMRAVSSGAFRLIGVPLVSGRELTASDGPGAPRMAVVNETLAKRLSGKGSPLGMTVELTSDWGDEPVHVVGVVKDFRDHLVRATRPEIYVSLDQHPAHQATVVFRATRSTEEMTRVLGEAVRRVDADEAISDVTPATQLVSRQTASARFVSALLTVFAAFALALAGFGIVAVVAAAVARRTREIAIRVAVGAPPRAVIALVTRDTLGAAAAGGAGGLLLAYNQSHLLRRLTSSVEQFDILLYSVAAATLLLVAVVAALVPAYKATRVDPIVALRAE